MHRPGLLPGPCLGWGQVLWWAGSGVPFFPSAISKLGWACISQSVFDADGPGWGGESSAFSLEVGGDASVPGSGTSHPPRPWAKAPGPTSPA